MKNKKFNKQVFILYCFGILFFLPTHFFPYAYQFNNDPIDVIIPCEKKDKDTLDLCIKGIRQNGKNIRNIIVISSERFTNAADWYDEKDFPFSKESLATEIFGNDSSAKNQFVNGTRARAGWLLQQLLKLYAIFIISDISPNVLILDADTIFLNPVNFQNSDNEPLFAYGNEYNSLYFEVAKKLLPYFMRVNNKYSGIAHHMLFQKPIVEHLFFEIKKYSNEEPWKAICHAINKNQIHGAFFSEYELYFNFVFLNSNQGHIRFLNFKNVSSYNETLLEYYKKKNFSYVSAHSWLR